MAQASHNNNPQQHPAIDFITTLFGPTTELPVFFQTLANDKGDRAEANITSALLTRDCEPIIRFIGKNDRARRGMFFCTSTLEPGSRTRNKENTRETGFVFSDQDFKNLAATEVEVRHLLSTLRYPPSILVHSGGGFHAYWLLTEGLDTQAHRDRIEALLRALARLVGGDLSVCEVSRLMRLPGTHNSKYGDQREVRTEYNNGTRYEIEDLEEWVAEATPILTYIPDEPKAAKSAIGNPIADGVGQTDAIADTAAAAEDPFCAAALGYKPRVDVEATLAAMTPGNIHNSQRSVSAALIKAGQPIEEVIEILMDATRSAAGDVGKKWNWRIEQRDLRKMCEGALAKYPPPPDEESEEKYLPPPEEKVSRESPEAPPTNGDAPPEGAGIPPPSDAQPQQQGTQPQQGVIDFAKAKTGAARAKPKNPATALHIVLADAVLAVLRQRNQDLMFTDAGDYRYADGLWRMETERGLKAWLDSQLEQGARGLKMESTDRLIREARNYILRVPELHREDVPFDMHGCIPTLSGLVDPRTEPGSAGHITPPTAAHYCTWRMPFPYDPAARCPHWLQMLDDVFADRAPEARAAHIQILQELLGAGLIDKKSKALSRALVLVGGSNYGKSGLIDVAAGLFGRRKNTTPLDAIENAHGLMPFIHRVPWVLHEAFDAGKWHMSSVVKAIISGDSIQINVKGGKIFEHTPTAPIFWGSNTPPQFKEATDAIINRIIVLECRRRFDEDSPVGAAIEARRLKFEKPQDLVLAREMEGVLAWAISGLRQALERGYFILPDDARAAAENVRIDSNIAAGFIRDCVTFDPNKMVSTPDFSAAFASWWLENKGEERGIPRAEKIGWAIKALGDPRIAHDRVALRQNFRRYYAGLSLNIEGKRHWSNSVTSDAFVFQGKTTNTSNPADDPNNLIPSEWDDKPAIQAMRAAHEKMRDRSQDHLVANGHPEKNGHPEVTV